jgi:hypothetical protein
MMATTTKNNDLHEMLVFRVPQAARQRLVFPFLSTSKAISSRKQSPVRDQGEQNRHVTGVW